MESIHLKVVKSSFVFLLLMVSAIAFSQGSFRKTGSGLKFNIIKDEAGPTAKLGQLVSLHLIISDVKGTEIKNSYNSGKPILFPVKLSTFEGDIYDAVSLLSAGDSALFKIPADSMYSRVFRKVIPEELSGTDLDLNVKVFKIWDQKERESELKSKVSGLTAQEEKRRQKEDLEIQSFIKKEGLNVEKTPGGVYYEVVKKGKGTNVPEKGKTILLNYEGKLLNGTVFETTYNEDDVGRPISFVLGAGSVIAGWEEIVPLLKEGDYVSVIVPSHLAFGDHKKSELILENTPLFFNLEVMGVR